MATEIGDIEMIKVLLSSNKIDLNQKTILIFKLLYRFTCEPNYSKSIIFEWNFKTKYFFYNISISKFSF